MKTPEYKNAIRNLAIKAANGELKAYQLVDRAEEIWNDHGTESTEVVIQDMMIAYGDHCVKAYKEDRDLEDRIHWERSNL